MPALIAPPSSPAGGRLRPSAQTTNTTARAASARDQPALGTGRRDSRRRYADVASPIIEPKPTGRARDRSFSSSRLPRPAGLSPPVRTRFPGDQDQRCRHVQER